jgi:hypothetical protein
MRTALFTLLRRLTQEAVLIRILAAILGHAAAVQGAEDGVRAVVFGQVFFVLGQLGLVVVELACGAVELRFRVGYGFRFGAVCVRRGEDAVFDEGYAEVA